MAFLTSFSKYLNENLLSSMFIFIVLIGCFLWFHVYMATEGIAELRAWLHDKNRSTPSLVLLFIPVYFVCIFFWILQLIFFMVTANMLINAFKGKE